MRTPTIDEHELTRRRERRTEADVPAARPDPGVAALLALQRGAGNHAVARMLQRAPDGESEEAAPEEAPEDAAGVMPGNVMTPTDESPRPPWRPAPTEAELGVPLDETEVGEAEAEEGPVLARWPGSKTKKAPKPAKVEGVMTPQDDFSGRSHSSFGVGEVVDLSFKSKPSVTAASLGGLQWEVTSGPATVVSAVDGTGTLTCDETAGKVTLSLKVASGADVGTVKDTRTLTVVEPDDARMVRTPGTGLRHTKGKAGVGFQGEIFLRPRNVSFHWMEFSEGSVSAVATGSFAHWNGLAHAIGNTHDVGSGNSSDGSKVNCVDSVDSGDLDPPFAKGEFDWSIPWRFRANGSAWADFTTAVHHAGSDSKGTATIKKKGSGSFSKKAGDATSAI